jgi:hypothetical protein
MRITPLAVVCAGTSAYILFSREKKVSKKSFGAKLRFAYGSARLTGRLPLVGPKAKQSFAQKVLLVTFLSRKVIRN